ncbi:hypothetical protein [Pleurocapsa sp. FMAR1]|uniref:hypothetical protein n=1 Tax=Pleurocapsa sp. FMAR1 TaxID=3040204 RepID=UPI0029C84CA0|nr:hypothetical protein [Pleurocapsa sp. FMAR1]
MPGQPSLVMCRYFEEMARMVRTDGKIVFDMVTEGCLNDVMLKNWFIAGAGYQHYPCLMSKQLALDLLSRRDCAFVGSFFVPMKPGKLSVWRFVKSNFNREIR